MQALQRVPSASRGAAGRQVDPFCGGATLRTTDRLHPFTHQETTMTDHVTRPEQPERGAPALVSAVCLALAMAIIALACTYI